MVIDAVLADEQIADANSQGIQAVRKNHVATGLIQPPEEACPRAVRPAMPGAQTPDELVGQEKHARPGSAQLHSGMDGDPLEPPAPSMRLVGPAPLADVRGQLAPDRPRRASAGSG